MLHAHRSEKNLREPFCASREKSSNLGFSGADLNEASDDLETLLSQALTPNKRAVIQALINVWESNHHRVHLEQTG